MSRENARIHEGCKDAAGLASPRHPPSGARQALGKAASLPRAHTTRNLRPHPCTSTLLLPGTLAVSDLTSSAFLITPSQKGGILRASPNGISREPEEVCIVWD